MSAKIESLTIALLLGLLLLGACTSMGTPGKAPPPDVPDVQVARALEKRVLAGCTPDLLDCAGLSVEQAETVNDLSNRPYRLEEKAYYSSARFTGEELPQLCVAMSGGGLRSAATNIGALQGLQDLGLLSKVDIMSSVSGGSYANLWYHVHQVARLYHAEEDTKNPLKEGGIAQQGVERGRFVSWASIPLSALMDWAWNRLVLPLYSLVNGRNQQASFTSSESSYESDIYMYFVFDGAYRWLARPPNWHDLEQTRPFFIINATAATVACPPVDSLSAFKNIFEFTPLRWGSRFFGYSWDEPDDVGMSPLAAVAASGAVSDAPGPACWTASWIGLPLGATLPYFRDVGRWGIENHQQDLQSKYSRERWGTKNLILSDGGGVDNTGIVSLTGRLCRRIIAIDASLPPKEPKKNEKSDKSDKRCRAQIEAQIAKRGAEVVPSSCGFEQVAEILTKEFAPAKLSIQKFTPPFAQMSVRAFPYPKSEPLSLTIEYLRLDFNQEIRAGAIKLLQEKVVEGDTTYYRDAIKFLEQDPLPHSFPWAPTTREAFSRAEFQAYEAVGRYLVHRYLGLSD
jgi:hypothetical protein